MLTKWTTNLYCFLFGHQVIVRRWRGSVRLECGRCGIPDLVKHLRGEGPWP
jgi:hypothetical protein